MKEDRETLYKNERKQRIKKFSALEKRVLKLLTKYLQLQEILRY